MLTNKQRIVVVFAVIGLSISLAMLYIGTHSTWGQAPAPWSLHTRLNALALALLVPGLPFD